MNTFEAVELAEQMLEKHKITARELRHLLDSGAISELVDAARCSDAYEDDRPTTPIKGPIPPWMKRWIEAEVVQANRSIQLLQDVRNGGRIQFDLYPPLQPITDFTSPGIGP